MKKFLRVIAIVFVVLIVAIFAFYLVKNEKLPEMEASPQADMLAAEMLDAMNQAAWDSTEVVKWTFRGDHHYEWNRTTKEVTLKWDDVTAIFNHETQEGIVTREGSPISEEDQSLMLKNAWDFFNNDSFWLAAPYKVFDPGTVRSIVTCADGREGLMVTYTSGGTTPGDSYVWILGEDKRPVACKMWVSIIPIGGMEFSWENYMTLPSGALVAQDHFMDMTGMNVNLSKVAEIE